MARFRKQRIRRRHRPKTQRSENVLAAWALAITLLTSLIVSATTVWVTERNRNASKVVISEVDQKQIADLTMELKRIWKETKSVEAESPAWEALHEQRQELEIQRWLIRHKYDPSLDPPDTEYSLRGRTPMPLLLLVSAWALMALFGSSYLILRSIFVSQRRLWRLLAGFALLLVAAIGFYVSIAGWGDYLV